MVGVPILNYWLVKQVLSGKLDGNIVLLHMAYLCMYLAMHSLYVNQYNKYERVTCLQGGYRSRPIKYKILASLLAMIMLLILCAFKLYEYL